MPVLKDRHVVISRARNGREIYDTVCEWLNTTNYFKWTDDSVSYNNELEELDRKRRMLLLRRKISECGCVVLFAEMYGNYKEWIDLAIEATDWCPGLGCFSCAKADADQLPGNGKM